jgi:glucose-6-phosphate 1-epimerase
MVMGYFISTLPSGQQLLHVENDFSKAIISLFGGQLLSWIPNDGREVLFLSSKAVFDGSTAIRGGIPICWPWFGNRENASSHGFARNLVWKFSKIVEEPKVSVVELTLEHDVKEYIGLQLSLRFRIADTLETTLISHNLSNQNYTITQALHTYLSIKDINTTKIQGFENNEYLDKVKNVTSINPLKEFVIDDEFDRIFVSNTDHKVIDDERIFIIEKSGCENTVVWNPWIERSKAIIDLENNEYKQFICVEAANISKPLELKPLQKHELSQKISLAIM